MFGSHGRTDPGGVFFFGEVRCWTMIRIYLVGGEWGGEQRAGWLAYLLLGGLGEIVGSALSKVNEGRVWAVGGVGGWKERRGRRIARKVLVIEF